MRRATVYAGQVPLETDILNSNKNAFVALGHVLQDMLGTSTLFSGLGCVPTSPAGMTVNVNPGRAYSLQATDNGAWSSLSADSRQLVKQGILLDAVNFSCPAPTTAGFSINYLIQGAFQEVDGGSTVLPYYNASNPAQAYNGPNGTGTSNTTYRDNTVQLQVKAGVAATTGSQITPTPDAGFNGLWVITVVFGATTITSGNITQYSGAPFLSADLLTQVNARALLAGSSTQTFSVAPATQSQHAVQYGQMLAGGYTIATSVTYTNGLASNGAVLLANNVGYQAKTTGGAAIAIAFIDATNNANFGNNAIPTVIGGSAIQTAQPLTVPAATASGHAMNASQAFGSPLQTYQSLTGSRALNTTYTNSSGRPIFVAIAASAGASGSAIGIFISGQGEVSVSTGTAASAALCVNAVVPPGATYVVSSTGTASTLANWNEYR